MLFSQFLFLREGFDKALRVWVPLGRLGVATPILADPTSQPTNPQAGRSEMAS